MRIEKQALPTILSVYIDSHMIANAQGIQKFAIAAAGVVLVNHADKIINHPQIQSYGEFAGIIDDKGYIDLDEAKKILKETFDKTNNELSVMGCVFDKSDVDALYEIALQLKGASNE